MGGLPRRATFIEQEKAEGPDTLLLDSGNMFSEKPLQEATLETAGLKAELIVRTMGRMGYTAAAVGEQDLYLGLERLRSLAGLTKVRFLSANLTDGEGNPLFEPSFVTRAGGLMVGIIGLTAQPSDASMFSRRMADSQVKDPVSAARDALDKIRGQCDLVVVLSNLGYGNDLTLIKEVPGIDVVVSGRSRRFMSRAVIENGTLITSGYYQGRAVGKLVIHFQGPVKGWVSRDEMQFLDKQIQTTETKQSVPAGKRKYESLVAQKNEASARTLYEHRMVNLDPSFPDDPAVVKMISQYRRSLSEQPGAVTGTGAAPEETMRYTGSQACARCHEARHRFWLTTAHSRALESLAPKDAGADPDCLPCHVTGYERRTGYWPKAPRPELAGVQCEACHGVGSLHVGSPSLYSLLHLPLAPQCMDCHTEGQDDDFDYLRDKGKICGEM